MKFKNVTIKIDDELSITYVDDFNSILLTGGASDSDSIRENMLEAYALVCVRELEEYQEKFTSDVPEKIVIQKMKEDYDAYGSDYVLGRLYASGYGTLAPEIDRFGPFDYKFLTKEEALSQKIKNNIDNEDIEMG